MSILEVVSVNVGKVALLGKRRGRPVYSAIRKTPVWGDVAFYLGPLGLVGDEQQDERVTASGKRIHGGPEKAVYLFPSVHYTKWHLELGQNLGSGNFGENVTVAGGLTEADVLLGEQWSWGEAILEVTGPRRPCYKLDMLLGEGTAATMMRTGRCGWYCRVIRPGRVPSPGIMRRSYQPAQGTSVLEAFRDKIRRDPSIPDMPD